MRAKRSAGRQPSGLVAAAVALGAVGLVACSDDDHRALQEVVEDRPVADWDVQPGVEQVTVTGAEPGQPLTLYDDDGEARTTVEADDDGRAHFAYLPEDPTVSVAEAIGSGAAAGTTLRPGEYVVRDDSDEDGPVSEPFEVLDRDESVPEDSFYDRQELSGVDLDVLGEPAAGDEMADGYQYLEMRDGVKLSAMVRFPDRSLYGDGPWPTVVEYSGYGPSNPGAEEPGSRLARSLGYATVSVNMRGTGCSGGVFDTFDPAQQADGYDVVEIVARQRWVLHNHVGMVGLSYSGISQLYTAATRPPHLAAVTAQSVIADPWLQQWPGGIYNDGFTRQWLAQRQAESGPDGSGWVEQRIDGGDDTCEADVADHGMTMDFEAFARSLAMRPPDAADRDLRRMVGDIDAAVFVTGAFSDEQTGPQFGTMLDDFDQARALRVGLWNGRHPDGYSTMNVAQWFEFLELYVAERVPRFPGELRATLADVVAESFGFADGELPPDRLYEAYGDDYDAALAAYEEEDPVRVVFGSGGGANEPGEPGGTFEATFASWPPPDAAPTTWYLGPQGALEPDGVGGPADEEVDGFRFDPEAGDTTTLAGYDTLAPRQEWAWSRFPDGRAVAYQTEPLDEDLVLTGSGYVDLWVGANAAGHDADVQVAVSELRPDGTEVLVQTGWLRLGHRAVTAEPGDDLEIARSFTQDDYAALPEGELVQAQVEIPAMGHVVGAGSRLRLTISSPGRNHVTWTFEPPEGVTANTTYRVGRGGATPSALVLPVADLDVTPAGVAAVPCGALRGVPCREAQPIRNHPAR
jgi:uncharacterized protein